MSPTGERGPAPKRDAERRRRNKPDAETVEVKQDEVDLPDFELPVAPEWWHPTAVMLWDSFKASLQSVFYEPTDWMLAYVLCEDVSREQKPKPTPVGTDSEGGTIYEMMYMPMPGAKLTAINKTMASLLANEADRRRLHIELNRKNLAGGEDDDVDITEHRAELFSIEGGAS